MAQVTLSIGGQHITSIITADAVREMRLKVGSARRRADQIHRSHDRPSLIQLRALPHRSHQPLQVPHIFDLT